MSNEPSVPDFGVMQPGWYTDPFGSSDEYVRYWDGSRWQQSASRSSLADLTDRHDPALGVMLASGGDPQSNRPAPVIRDTHGVVALGMMFLGLLVGFLPVVGWLMFVLLPAGLVVAFIGGVKAVRARRTAFLSWLSVGIGVVLTSGVTFGLLMLLTGTFDRVP